jgi:hypothetical protein
VLGHTMESCDRTAAERAKKNAPAQAHGAKRTLGVRVQRANLRGPLRRSGAVQSHARMR